MANTPVDLAFERRLLDSMGRILLTDRDFTLARTGLLELSERLREVAHVAFKHKVTTIVSANARSLQGDPDSNVAASAELLVSLLAADEEAALEHRSLLLGEVQRISAQLGNRAVVIKGFCNSRFYPTHYTRWMRDIDLLCPSWTDALELLESLLADGYEFDLQECSWVKADPSQDRDLYGQIFLIRAIGSDFSRVDIHFGTYSVGYAGYLKLGNDIFDELRLASGGAINVLKAELCPLIAQAHALSDGYVSAKDINDFVSMSLVGSIDWRAIGARLRDHELHPQATQLAAHVLSLYDQAEVVAAAEDLLAGLGHGRRTPRTHWQTHNRDWGLRARVNTSFAYRWRRHQGSGRTRGTVDAVRCFLFYIRRLKLTVRDRTPRERLLRMMMAAPDLVQWKLRPDACTLLIDAGVVRSIVESRDFAAPQHLSDRVVPIPVAPGIGVGGTTGLEVVSLGQRTFIPTLDLIIPPAHAEIADRV